MEFEILTMENILGFLAFVSLTLFVLSAIVGLIARKRGRSFIGYTLLSTMVTPFIGLVIVLCLKKDHAELAQRIA